MLYDKVFTMKMSQAMRDYIATLGKSMGMSGAEFLRQLVLRDAREREMYDYLLRKEQEHDNG